MTKSTELQLPLPISEFDYPLPDERIAKYPLQKRDASRLLLYKNGKISETVFSDIVNFLPGNALLVYNNTRVIQARLLFEKETGAKIEVFCLEPIKPADYAQSLGATSTCVWKCMVGNLKKWKKSTVLKKKLIIGTENCTFSAELLETETNTHQILFGWDNPQIHFADILESAGELPIPPYLHRKTEESDLTTYQTVYSKIKGSVAAPTAGLHFTDEVLNQLCTKGIEIDEVTLHVGAGTFQPVKTEDVNEHHMHTETIAIERSTIEHIQQKLGNIVAVGTTSVRTLESLYYIGASPLNLPQGDFVNFHVSQWKPYKQNFDISARQALQNILDYMDANNLKMLHADTQIMIKPGYEFKIVNAIITNFHQPKSTLLLLVSAFVNGDWRSIYNYALSHNFRFLSYGDSSLLIR